MEMKLHCIIKLFTSIYTYQFKSEHKILFPNIETENNMVVCDVVWKKNKTKKTKEKRKIKTGARKLYRLSWHFWHIQPQSSTLFQNASVLVLVVLSCFAGYVLSILLLFLSSYSPLSKPNSSYFDSFILLFDFCVFYLILNRRPFWFHVFFIFSWCVAQVFFSYHTTA